jgi:acyl-CoA dehydrogenase
MIGSLLAEIADEIMASVCTDEALRAAEQDGFAPEAWAGVAEAGLPWISVPESAGGEGGELAEALEVLRVAGRHGLPLPLAETGVLAGWLCAASGLQVTRVPATVATGDGLTWQDGTVRGVARLVPWGRSAGRIVTLLPAAEPVAAVFSAADLRVEPHMNVAGEPRDTVYFDGTAPLASASAGPGVNAETLRRRGALARVTLMAGAVRGIFHITVRYTGERHQFGRPIGRFPGVQQHVVHIGQQVATLEMAADALRDLAARDPNLASSAAAFQVAAAKSVADEAATIATSAAHQAHGAMGMTQEYPLHNLTRRMWAWTREWGTGAQSADELGAIVAGIGADALWPLIASGGVIAG